MLNCPPLQPEASTETSMPIRTLLYEDNTDLRGALAALIGGTEGYELTTGCSKRCAPARAAICSKKQRPPASSRPSAK